MKYYQGMGIFTPGEQRNTEYLKLKYSPSTSEAEAAFQCGQRNSLKTINVDGEHIICFRGKSCVFKFIRLSVNVA